MKHVTAAPGALTDVSAPRGQQGVARNARDEHSVTLASLSWTAASLSSGVLLFHPLWRRVLGLRVLLALPIVLWLQNSALAWLDASHYMQTLPGSLIWLRGAWAGTGIVSLLFAAGFAIQDVAVCLLSPGPFRKAVLLGEEAREAREALLSNETVAWNLLVIPTLIPIALLAAGAVILGALGTTPMLAAAIAHAVTGATRWMIVAAALTLTLLLKR